MRATGKKLAGVLVTSGVAFGGLMVLASPAWAAIDESTCTRSIADSGLAGKVLYDSASASAKPVLCSYPANSDGTCALTSSGGPTADDKRCYSVIG